MNVTLNWTVGVGATSQNVQYKKSTDAVWVTFSTVAGNATTETVTGLVDNYIYDLRIVTNCASGSPAPSQTIQKINFTCPAVTTTKTSASISYSFSDAGASITSYQVKLFNSAGDTEVASSTPTGTTTRTGTFSSLSSSTTYKLRVIPVAGTFSKTDCAFVSITTDAPAVCALPTAVTATLAAV